MEVIGGTSLAAPLVAGMVNVARNSATGSQQELGRVYSHAGDGSKLRDIVKGSAVRIALLQDRLHYGIGQLT